MATRKPKPLNGCTPCYYLPGGPKWHEEEHALRAEQASLLEAMARAFRQPGVRVYVKGITFNDDGPHWVQRVEKLAKRMRAFFPIEFGINDGGDPEWRGQDRLYICAPMSGLTVKR